MIKLSLIIPVYNVEKYLERCLESCVRQDLPLDEYEIIIINDGTKDNSLSIAERFKTEYNNITIYSQENKGLSAARNKGLSLAKGEYVWFIDSDDWIEENCIAEVVNHCYTKELDILLICSADYIENLPVRSFNNTDFGILPGKEIMKSLDFQICVPFHIFKRDFLVSNSLVFFKGIFHEDSEFTPRAYYLAERVSSLNKVLYFVCQNPNSITRTVNPKKAFDLIQVALSLSEFSNKVLPNYKYIFDYLVSLNVNSSLNNSYFINKMDNRRLNRTIYENKHLFKHLINSNKIKYKIEGFLFKVFPRHTIQVYKLIQNFNFSQIKHNIKHNNGRKIR